MYRLCRRLRRQAGSYRVRRILQSICTQVTGFGVYTIQRVAGDRAGKGAQNCTVCLSICAAGVSLGLTIA